MSELSVLNDSYEASTSTVFENISDLQKSIEDKKRMMMAISNKEITHPILKKYTLSTIQMMNTENEILEVIYSQNTGIAVYGNQRIGKTTCREHLEKELRSGQCGELLVLSTELSPSGYTRESLFINHLYKDFNIEKPYPGVTAVESKDNLIATIIDLAHRHGDRLVLFIDEAQWLTGREYKYLLHLQNRVLKGGISFTAVLFGNQQLKASIETLKRAGEYQITDRFMNKVSRMYGLKDNAAFRYFVSMYDVSIAPEVDKTFTEYYFPEAYKDGKTFCDDYMQFYEALTGITKQYSIPELLMSDVVSVMNHIFTIVGIHGKAKYWPDEKDWKEAMISSGIIDRVVEASKRKQN